MRYRLLGKTGWQVSVIGLGTWNIGGQWGEVDERTALATIWRAYENGINFFDTADAYGEPPGRSEELLGKALQGIRQEVIIATKVGNWARRYGHPLPYTSPLHVIACCHASLYRLRTDAIDLYQCHIGNPTDAEVEVFLDAFERLKAQGKIRAYGISTNSLDALQRFNRHGTCATCQLDYSLLNRTPEKDLLPYCREHNIGVIVRGPLAKGVLAGKFTPETVFTDEVRRSWNEGERRAQFLRQLQAVERLRFLEREGRTIAQAALQFVLAHPAVTCAIPGAKNPRQAETNAQAADGALTEDELAAINAVVPPASALA
ncbi:General stress protein 69 [bacterium HR17]|uniref:General stress protein 69 n=1 Tax=Candidatus Fervidibacter japonicus TaxID=2035412 RepID=A0A2H5X8T9_9BACT|nr:General stress protein 69 [bacterium HR17]